MGKYGQRVNVSLLQAIPQGTTAGPYGRRTDPG